ncbi:MAG TPA: acyl carrier protein phosphodiesterase [Luteibaculaceae bacterium]|nr:acyl carrier protein phosphodiesterase [Luteibaculaceae bacterium]
MNYLAHAYLSGTDEQVLIGNFIADGLPGSRIDHLPKGVQLGVKLHRFIDSYTDQHPVNESIKRALHPIAGKWAGVVVDICYDHILAKNWADHHHLDLAVFVERTYTTVGGFESHFPERLAYMFSYMRSQNWLLHYAEPEGVLQSLGGLSRRISSRPPLREAGEWLLGENQLVSESFSAFFPDLYQQCQIWLDANRISN